MNRFANVATTLLTSCRLHALHVLMRNLAHCAEDLALVHHIVKNGGRYLKVTDLRNRGVYDVCHV